MRCCYFRWRPAFILDATAARRQGPGCCSIAIPTGAAPLLDFPARDRPATTWDAARATSGYPTFSAPKGKNEISAGARQMSSSEIMRYRSYALRQSSRKIACAAGSVSSPAQTARHMRRSKSSGNGYSVRPMPAETLSHGKKR
jgi:hypothetical protein